MLALAGVVGVACGIGTSDTADADGLSVNVQVPYIAPGVEAGTSVLLRGHPVGEVRTVTTSAGAPIELHLVLDEERAAGLTDTFTLDFRPENYFGSTAVTLEPGAGGRTLQRGDAVTKVPEGDFSMATMLEQGSLTVDATLTRSIIDSMDKTVHYLDGMTSWLDTGVTVTDRVARAQQQLPSELFERFNDIMTETPGFTDNLSKALYILYHSAFHRMPDGSIGVDDAFLEETNRGLVLASSQLFGQAGTLLASHETELLPLISTVQAMSDLFPHMSNLAADPSVVQQLRTELESAFVDTDNGRQLRLRVVLDDLPAFVAPLGNPTEGGAG
ncbi:Mce family protein (plasmid) [Rhodococcus rhodochrous]|nr:Mce family protein [Rhodococcus rhodochrous]